MAIQLAVIFNFNKLLRFVKEEEEKVTLQKHCAAYERRVQELQVGMQELGREHQSLQIVKSRQSERKWEQDREVVSCHNCNAKFSVSIRKVGQSLLIMASRFENQ